LRRLTTSKAVCHRTYIRTLTPDAQAEWSIPSSEYIRVRAGLWG
jgi:hypothetical protein